MTQINSGKVIKYLAHYNCPESKQNRYMAPSACTKIDYIAEKIATVCAGVEIISASNSMDKSYKATTINKSENWSVKFLRGFERIGRLGGKIATLLFSINLFYSLLREIKVGDTVIVYHSLSLMRKISFLKRVKEFKLILEVEEIYGDVLENKKVSDRELEYFKCADAYIFPTKLLDKKVNIQKKPSVIIHGTYREEEKRICKKHYCALHGWDDKKAHIVYAGTFDPRKGGAIAAASAAEHLTDGYHIHILGFGSDSEKKNIQDKIDAISKRSTCMITYDGCLIGDEYVEFIQSCDVGLSTQNPDASFNATSFPSKILSYMSNGLRVVSIRIPAIETSEIGEYLYYYDEQSPEEIAAAILEIDFACEYDSRRIIAQLDKEFSKSLEELLL